jgi:hypothetical protein
MTLITQKWLEDALRHLECAEYVKIPSAQFVELVQAARNGMRPVLVHPVERHRLGESSTEANTRPSPPKVV